MSIATAITNLQGKIANAYTAIENKGGTLPTTQNAENLSATIDGIPAGSKFGTTIDEVFHTTTTGDETTLKVFGGVTNLTFDGVTNVSGSGLYYKFNKSGITGVSFPALKTLSGISTAEQAFAGCTSLSSVSFPELTTINGQAIFKYAFQGCTSLSSVSFPKLSAIGNNFTNFQYAFQGCTSLSSVSFPELEIIVGDDTFTDAFKSCSNMTGLSFPKLKSISGKKVFGTTWNEMTLASTTVSFPELSAIRNSGTAATYSTFNFNKNITRFDFPKLTVIAKGSSDTVDALYLFGNCTNLVEIHFGAENQSIIEAASGYASKWGAPSGCQIYFDL